MGAITHKPRRRRLTQPERSAATRQALLDSTIECLIELGYDQSTTAEISERAGLSRGAHLHHFQTRGALIVAAAQELARRMGAIREASEVTGAVAIGARLGTETA
jgi:AcrR family transcriptional regulator